MGMVPKNGQGRRRPTTVALVHALSGRIVELMGTQAGVDDTLRMAACQAAADTYASSIERDLANARIGAEFSQYVPPASDDDGGQGGTA